MISAAIRGVILKAKEAKVTRSDKIVARKFIKMNAESVVPGQHPPLQLYTTLDIVLGGDRRACIVTVPVSFFKTCRTLGIDMSKVLGESEKGVTFLFIGQRKINAKQDGRKGLRVPKSTTRSYVYERFAEDLVFPAHVVGRRVRRRSGKDLYRIILEDKSRTSIEPISAILSAAYLRLTGRKAVFGFESDYYST